MGRDAALIGLAGELRVMSELLLRGHNPAKSYLDFGVDIILESGIKIQIKTATSLTKYYKKWDASGYFFNMNRTEDKTNAQFDQQVDYVICTVPAEGLFFIIPTRDWVKRSSIYIPTSLRSKWAKYKDNWEVLR